MITTPIAKINLGLNVVERRPDGYHNLQTVFYPVAIKDALEVSHLYKGIPAQAGMGGGSSDASAMLLLLNREFQLGLSEEQLIGYAAKLGADCAFFVMNRPAYAEGIGEKLQPINLDLSNWYIAVVRPDIPVPTKEAFSRITPAFPKKCCKDIVMQPVETWREELTNDFEQSVFALHPESYEWKRQCPLRTVQEPY